MNKTKIEYCDYTWNPMTGCKHGCDYCYARRIAERFSGRAFPDGFEPTWHPKRLVEPVLVDKPARIFVCNMGDLFGQWVKAEQIEAVISVARQCPQHIFQFLTKNPVRYGEFSFPANCWIGTTIEIPDDTFTRLHDLKRANHDGIKWISFEPLLGAPEFEFSLKGINWITIGALTGSKCMTADADVLRWAGELIRLARKEGVAIFVKGNLGWPTKIEEYPTRR